MKALQYTNLSPICLYDGFTSRTEYCDTAGRACPSVSSSPR